MVSLQAGDEDSLATLVTTLTANGKQPPRTVEELARRAGCSERTLRYRCRRVGLTPKALLDFTRCLLIVVHAGRGGWSPETAVAAFVTDVRTIRRLKRTAGFTAEAPTVSQFMSQQRFFRSRSLLGTIQERLS
jgi:AraC-like DNA-binding protein